MSQSMRQAFLTDICNQMGAINLSSEDPEENWAVFHRTVHSLAATTLGHPARKHEDWFDENVDGIQRLLIRKTCPCNEYPLKPHVYIAKLGYAGVYLFFLFLLQNIDCRGGSNVYPQSMF